MEQKAILIGVNVQNDLKFEASMRELESLAAACGIETAGVLAQKLERVNPTHYIGTGKVEEIAAYLRGTGAQTVIFNDELSPSQIRNLSRDLDCTVKDRTMLILDIFASRARTTEAKLQVEAANLQYMLPRLTGLKTQLSQQTGGVGTTNRGAGEKKLELNRRQIGERISHLETELEALVARRQTQRRQRRKSGVPVVSLVGYTNAGKSTVMNALLDRSDPDAGKKVLEKDMLFATLETSVRKIRLPDNKTFLLTDTVGFIDKLPHHLVKAFRSTLEEVKEADLLLHVVDCSNPAYAEQMAVTEQTLREIGVENIPVIVVYNKADLMDIQPSANGRDSVVLSARTGAGLDGLTGLIERRVFEDYVRCEMLIPYGQGEAVSYLNERANVLSVGYEQGGTRLMLDCRRADYEKYSRFALAQPQNM